ncbi:WD40-repeat-containing domain protein [Tuber borchii]|uniref:WD40-repeat-containing domain protein n=1 Tax=Tuber borchii TaxID=42251 RepID=A0A2T7A4P5_TUBBO|nr:WD40-repeat-containing domain protein [Tuber borchii]
MGKKSRSKPGPSKSTSLVLADPAPSEKKTKNKVPAQEKDAEEEFLEKLIFGDAEGFEAGLNELDGGYSDDSDREEGGGIALAGDGDGDVDAGEDLQALRDDELFFVDEGPSGMDVILTKGPEEGGEEEEEEDDLPAWQDSDDEMLTISLANRGLLRKLRDTESEDLISGKEYSARLRRQFERIYPVPEWAAAAGGSDRRKRGGSSSDEEMGGVEEEGGDEEAVRSAPSLEEILRSTTTNWTRKVPGRLRPEKLTIVRLADGNRIGGSLSMISTLHFHPHHPLLLSSGPDSTLRLHHINGTTNPPATSLHLRNTPISTAHFHPSGTSIIAAGRRKYFHIWNLSTGTIQKVTRIYGHAEVQKSMETFRISPDGKFMALVASRGFVNVLNATTYQWVCAAKIEGRVADISWWGDSHGLTIGNKAGGVWEFDVLSEKVVARWQDEGGHATTVVKNGGNRWIAIGSQSGIVNIYDRTRSFGTTTSNTSNNVLAGGTKEKPKPVRVLEQLVTAVGVIEFSPDCQVLAIASKGKKDALRMVHLPSCTVYQNWPTSGTPLGRVTAISWAGKETGIVAIGNEAGKVRLFEIQA